MLLRHGKALSPSPGQNDHDRPLAERGRQEATRQGAAFPHQSGDALIVSDAVRTRQTLQALIDGWGHPDTEPHITPTGYLADAETWMELVAMAPPDAKRVWVIGHNPGISELAMHLSGQYVGMSTADIVHIELDLPTWTDIARGCGRLIGHHPGRNA